MKIGLRGGHSPNCKGAIGILDEQDEVRKIYNALAPMLQAAGHVVVNCNSNANSVNAELSEGTNKANSNNCDIYVTIHMNASDGAGHGTKFSAGLLYLNASAMPAMIVETLFCDNAGDAALYGKLGAAAGIARLIAEGITDKSKDKGYFFDGIGVRELNHPDEKKALQQTYRECTGREIPEKLYTTKALWYQRQQDVINRPYLKKF